MGLILASIGILLGVVLFVVLFDMLINGKTLKDEIFTLLIGLIFLVPVIMVCGIIFSIGYLLYQI